MPVIRTFITKTKPGRMQDAMSQVAGAGRAFLETGATHFGAYSMLSGPNFPGMMIHAIYEDFATFGEARQKVLEHPDGGAAAFAADAPQEVVRAILEEPVYRAGGDDAGDWLAQTKVRFAFTLQPSRGRTADVIRRASRLADTAADCGAIAASVRRIVAGSDYPMLVFASYHQGYAEFEATRNKVVASDVWTAISSSQDEAAARGASSLAAKIPV
jgi:hypothetical protein